MNNTANQPTVKEITDAAYARGIATDEASNHDLMLEGHAWVATMTGIPAAHANLMTAWREGVGKARYEQYRAKVAA